MQYDPRWKNFFFNIWFCFIVFVVLGGCSISYVDSEGDKRVIGLVDLKVKKQMESTKNGAEINEVTSIGLAIYKNPENSGVALGYNREMIMSVRGNTCVAMQFHPTRWIDPAKVRFKPVN